jgi:recombination protein RecR
MASQEIEALTQALARLPGLGPRSARRAVLHLMKKRETALQPLLRALVSVSERLSVCGACGNVDTTDPCGICVDPRRDARLLCVVEEVSDLWALDRSRLFPGRFHVLGGRLSALEGVRPEDLGIDRLVSRVAAGGIDEIVLAMNATLPCAPNPTRPRPAGRRRARLSRRRDARSGAARSPAHQLKSLCK